MKVLSSACALLLGSLLALTAHAQERSPIYPYDVTVGGQAVEAPAGPADIFATVPRPIAPDARVEVDTEGEQIIVNVFPIDEEGAPLPGSQGRTKVIMVPEGTGFRLDATMDKSRLSPGRYGMNIVLQNKGTSRVRFVVGTPEQLAAAETRNPDTVSGSSATTTPAAPTKLNMAGVDRIGGAPGVNVPSKAQRPAAKATPINLYGTERLGIRHPPLSKTASIPSATASSDRSTPRATMKLFFELAKAGKFESIRELESPDADGDVREICAIADAPDKDKERYQSFFGGGRILGQARIDGDTAEVDFTMGDKQERRETMNLKRIESVWYLSHF